MTHNYLNVDWTKIPKPIDDGAGAHLTGMSFPDILLKAHNGAWIDLGKKRVLW